MEDRVKLDELTYGLADRGVRIGTCSWTDPTLLKASFYPKRSMTAEARLGFYASRFPIAEIDATYYAPPREGTAELWAERTPDGFVFDVKAFRLLTQHPTPLKTLWPDFRQRLPGAVLRKRNLYVRDLPREAQEEAFARFGEALMPLHRAGKLGVVLLQFPPYVHPGRGSFGYLRWAAAQWPEFRLAVEFRQSAWLDEAHREETLSFLERHGMTYVCVDAPQGFRSSVPPVAAVTAPVAQVRFHGRNTDTWEARGITAAERFRYDYGRDELEEWLPRIAGLRDEAREVHLLMNNCYGDYGVRSARLLAELLDASG